jgi:hypothetical protein
LTDDSPGIPGPFEIAWPAAAARRAIDYHRHMKRIAGRAIVLVVFAASVPLAALAQNRDAASRVPTVTRLVKLFLERETALIDAIRAGDAETIGSMLADDFELRTGTRAASPVPRAAFLQELARTRDGGGAVDRMAVHDLGSVAIASFRQGSGPGALFVVDVWRRAGADWKLAIRYASPAAAPAASIPGVGPAEMEIPKKY